MSPKPLPGVTRVTNAPQGRPALCSLPRNASARPAGIAGSDQWLLRNKIGLAMILSGVAFGVLTSSLLFGFVAWFGIILFFQKRGDEVGANVDMQSGAPALGTPEYAKAALASGNYRPNPMAIAEKMLALESVPPKA